ncbi:MAG: ATP synthase F0 subunit B [Nitrospiraceae bacterium]|nr:ATP synthase F0 subunit B [Nitrospiraceae bacterium]
MKKVQGSKFKVQSRAALISLLVAFQFLLFAAVAFAEEGGEAPQSLFKAYFWPIINFLVLVFLLVYAMKKADIKGYFKKRTELIEQSLKEAREAKELAQKALAQVEERLRVKDTEIEEIIASARVSGEKEKARLVEEGAKLQEKILEQAKTNIDFEVKQAKSAIKKEAAELAMELAEKKLKEKLTKEEQLKLLEESVAKIEGKN